jgi:ABC-type phosphate transport system substrate-binding protein
MLRSSRLRVGRPALGVAVVATAAIAAVGAQSSPVLILGGGSAFAAPLFKAWIGAFHSQEPAIDLEYDVIGSGEGVSRFLTGSLDFAATDVEYGFAARLGLPMAALENAAGVFVTPAPAGGEAAIASAEVADDLKIELPDPAGADAYPIVTFTWALLRNRADDVAKARAIRAFTQWAVGEGQRLAPDLGYVPLPAVVLKRAELALAATQ